MMSLELAKEIHHKYRKSIRVVQDHIKDGKLVTTEELMSAYGWSRTKAHDVLLTMSMLGILKQKPTTDDTVPTT